MEIENDYGTAEHSKHYNELGFMLVPINTNTPEKPVWRIYTPENDDAMYAFTCWLKDWELPWINQRRLQYCDRIKSIYRLARVKGGYKRVSNGAEKMAVEKKEFLEDNISLDIERFKPLAKANKF